MDKAGNLYWTSSNGPDAGQVDFGAVSELSPNGQGGWNFNILYAFPRNPPSEGTQPWAPVMIDSSGNLYGTTITGGGTKYPYDNGTVWEITP